MPFVKLDCSILDSSLWVDREGREVFLTALCMAVPKEIKEPMAQLAIGQKDETGFHVPPGWYGFVGASGTGIVRRAGLNITDGKVALERLGGPDQESRSADFEGRRLVRVDSGFIVMNYDRYREKDYTSAQRSKRYRDKKKQEIVTRDDRDVTRDITQAEAEVEAYNTPPPPPPLGHCSGLARPRREEHA